MDRYHALLLPLALAQDALARLEAGVAGVSPAVREGLVARLAWREAAGWLALQGSWVHPTDLALREAGVTGSYAAAELGSRLPSVLPATARSVAAEAAPEDRDVAAALAYGRGWRRLAELPSWTPDGMALPPADELPPLLTAAEIAGGMTAAAALRAGWLWRARGGTGVPGLPLFSAPLRMVQQVALAGTAVAVLGVIAEAARQGSRELARLNLAAARGAALKATARARLPEAVGVALRRPVLTARMLAETLGVSQRAAFDLVGRMVAGGLLRETTGRASWRAFVVI